MCYNTRRRRSQIESIFFTSSIWFVSTGTEKIIFSYLCLFNHFNFSCFVLSTIYHFLDYFYFYIYLHLHLFFWFEFIYTIFLPIFFCTISSFIIYFIKFCHIFYISYIFWYFLYPTRFYFLDSLNFWFFLFEFIFFVLFLFFPVISWHFYIFFLVFWKLIYLSLTHFF